MDRMFEFFDKILYIILSKGLLINTVCSATTTSAVNAYIGTNGSYLPFRFKANYGIEMSLHQYTTLFQW